MAAQFAVDLRAVRRADAEVQVLLISQETAEITGYDPHDFEDQPHLWRQIIHPEDVDRVRLAYEQLLSGIPMSQDYRIFRNDGQMRWVRETCCAPRRRGGPDVLVLSYIKDITAQRSALSELVQFRHILEGAPAALVVRDLLGRVVWCNEACARIYGFDSGAEMVGTAFDAVVPAELREEFHTRVRPRVFEGPWSGDLRLSRKDGTLVDVRISTNVLRESDGTPAGILGVVMDISEQKLAEQALRESEEKHRTLVERANDGIVVIQDKILKLVNRRFAEMSGYSVDQLLGTPFTDYLTPEEKRSFTTVTPGGWPERMSPRSTRPR